MTDGETTSGVTGHIIDGKEVAAKSGKTFPIVDPGTEEAFAEAAAGSATDIDQAIKSSIDAKADWQALAPEERGRLLRDIASTLRDNTDDLADILTRENGKPISQAKHDIAVGARYFEYYAGIADKIHGESIPLTREYVDYTIQEPLGVTGHIVPWNFPVMLFGRTVAPALAAGNVAVVKPAEQTPLTAVEVAKLALDIGLPPGVLNVVNGFGPEAGAPLAGHEEIDGIAFTGSVPTGQEVATLAVKNFNPVHIEAGGKNPNVVFADADLERALDSTVTSIFGLSAGQVCSSGDRLLLQEDIHDEFLERLTERTEQLSIGPGREDPDVGSIVSETQFKRICDYIDVGRAEVDDPVTGGDTLDGNGFFIQPTIFDGVENDLRIAQEEIFGPVLSVTTFENERDAIQKANDTKYGLVAGVFTKDNGRAHRFARDVQAGQIYINEWFAGGVETPFGGYKMSGFGREKGLEAIENFTQTKNVCANISR
ncbi:aldehyde dehydrogenase family protein [Haladaptatus sp. NG-WS-4]